MRTGPVALLACIGTALTARAQASVESTVRGSVFDSLSNQALARATVQLVSVETAQRFTVSSDAAGRFEIAYVPVGTYQIAFRHPRLDSLALSLRPRRIIVKEDETTANLATPSPTTLIGMICGTDAKVQTVAFGVVRSAENGHVVPGAAVVARWTTMVPRSRDLTELTMTDTSRADGGFALCGIPASAATDILATTGRDTTGTVIARFDSLPAVHLDLFVGSHATGRIAGTLVTREHTPVHGRVSLMNGSAEVEVSDDGRFELDSLPTGTQTLIARAIGFAPRQLVVNVVPGRTTDIEVDLSRAVVLSTVTTTATRNAAMVAAFRAAKAKAGSGFFVEARAPEGESPGTPAFDYAKGLPGVTTLKGGGIAMRRMNLSGDGVVHGKIQTPEANFCAPESRAVGTGDPGDPRDIVGVEVYPRPTEVPMRYRSRGRCGMIIVWTKQHATP